MDVYTTRANATPGLHRLNLICNRECGNDINTGFLRRVRGRIGTGNITLTEAAVHLEVNATTVFSKSEDESMNRRILFLAANPTNTGHLRLDAEYRGIEEGLRRSKEREKLELESKFAVRVADLRRSLLDFEPQIVHFAGHGEGADGILLEDDQGNSYQVPNDALANLFELCQSHTRCVVLNTCYSETQANAIVKHIPYVVGMKRGVKDDAALEFAEGFYDAIGAGRSIEDAFKFGCNAIALKKLPGHLTPVLKKRLNGG